MKKLLASVLTAALLSGCASSSVLVGNSRPEIDPDQVRIYLDPPAHFEKVALVDAGSHASWAISDQGKTNKVIERLKKEAAALGANGILITGMGDQQTGSVGTGQAWGYGGNTAYGFGVQSGVFEKKGHALAIYVFPDSPAVTAPVAPAEAAPPAMAAPSPTPAAQPAPAAQQSGWRSWGKKD